MGMLKFLSAPEHRAEVSSRDSSDPAASCGVCAAWHGRRRCAVHQDAPSPRTLRSRVAVREAPMPRAQTDALASYSEPCAREIVFPAPFQRCGDTLPSVPTPTAQSRALGFQGWRIP